MKAIVFGAGKIARGFIGQLLYLSKTDITFVDIDQQLVDRLNKDQKYHVYILGDSSLDSDVTGFQAVQLEDEKRIGAALVEADIAFVSVGGANLKSLGEKIGRIYKENGIPKKPFNFVTCENWRHAGAFLYEGITAEMEEQEKTMFDQFVGVNEAVIMRSATQPSDELAMQDATGVWVQNYWYLPISAEHFKGELPPIQDAELMQNAVIAYHGYLAGYELLAEAANSPEVSALLDEVYEEINQTLVAELHVDPQQQKAFAEKARAKYTDWTIVDRIIRHGKDPLRKLGAQDRLIAPARMALNHGVYPRVIIETIAKALFFDEESDASARKLKAMRREHGIPYVLQTVCELNEQEPLYREVLKAVDRICKEGLVKGRE